MKDINVELEAIADSIRYLADTIREAEKESVQATDHLVQIIRWSFMDDFDNNVVQGLRWVSLALKKDNDE